MTVLEQLREFLTSTKVDEILSPELRDAISINTGLQDALSSALIEGVDVVIAGSAGSGKTHLLKSMASQNPELPPFVPWPHSPEPSDSPFVRLVADLTPLSDSDRLSVFDNRPQNCRAVAIAANEGPLLSLSRGNPDSTFRRIVDLLHMAQNGVSQEYDPLTPTIFDAAGYDPVADGAISKILSLPAFADLADTVPCGCEDKSICPRRLAWDQLKAPEVRTRLNSLLLATNVHGQPVLFRELWDFIADIALGGNCQSQPPSSPWFWRVFFGSSSLSRRLRQVADPSLVVFPRAEAHAWYGDWYSDEVELMQDVNLVYPVVPPPFDALTYRWIKAQLFFVMSIDTMLDVIRDQVDLELAEAINNGRADALIAGINAYMSYGVVDAHSTMLSLWTDLRVERRDERSPGQVSLGEVHSRDFSVRRSIAVANHFDSDTHVDGSRSFLVHEDGSFASLALTPESLRLIREGRSHRTVDRLHTDMEWHLSRFFAQIASRTVNADSLRMLELDFASMRGQVRSYRVDLNLNKMEPVGDW